MDRTEQLRMREVHLQLPLTDTAARTLELGDAVFLSGLIFTGREGFYHQVFEKGLEPPLDLGHACNVTFHCSPAVNEPRPGEYHIPSVTATASFRFAKYVPLLLERYGIRAVIGKGGMQEEVYQTAFRQHGAIYLTTVGYGLGAIYGQGIRRVKDVLWKTSWAWPRRCGCSRSRTSAPSWSNATFKGAVSSGWPTPRSMKRLRNCYEGCRSQP